MEQKNTIKICVSGSCRRNFCADTIKTAEKELGIAMDEVTPNGEFSLQQCSCLGNCGEGPSAMINGRLYGRMYPKEIKKKIDELKE